MPSAQDVGVPPCAGTSAADGASRRRSAWIKLREEHEVFALAPLRLPEFEDLLGRVATDVTEDSVASVRARTYSRQGSKS